MRMDTITGNSVILKPIEECDTDLIIRWRNNPSVQKNFIFRETLTKEMHQEWLKNLVATKKVVQFIILRKDCGSKIGSVYLRDIDRTHNNAEFGIFIGEDSARGLGFGCEAASLICQFGFHSLFLHRIFLRVFAENKPAIRCYEKAGFSLEGIARDIVFLDGSYHDMVFMSILSNSCLDREQKPASLDSRS